MTSPLQAFATATTGHLVGIFARLWADCFDEASHRADRDIAAGHGYIGGDEVYADALDAFTTALANMRWHRERRNVARRRSANSDAPMAVAS